ncbi:MAG: hypothetical protein V7784_06220 [Oceanospirillaceae bacterium]
MVASFNVQNKHKTTSEKGGSIDRVILGYQRDENGDCKLALDVDNNHT